MFLKINDIRLNDNYMFLKKKLLHLPKKLCKQKNYLVNKMIKQSSD
jgi:hypothetical protein